jgi:hypothetical protein
MNGALAITFFWPRLFVYFFVMKKVKACRLEADTKFKLSWYLKFTKMNKLPVANYCK